MGLADDIVSKYQGTAEPESSEPMDSDGDESDRECGKALIAAVKKGDWKAAVEAVRSIR